MVSLGKERKKKTRCKISGSAKLLGCII